MTLQWQKTGKTTLLVAGTNEQVRAMNQRTILERRVLGLSDGDPSRLATLSDRPEDRSRGPDRVPRQRPPVRGPDGHRIENGMAFTVTRIDTDAIACRDADGRQWTIPRDWAKANCEAGYATTIHKSQGMTVDRCAAMFPSDARVPCNLQYVAATRGARRTTSSTRARTRRPGRRKPCYPDRTPTPKPSPANACSPRS